MPSVSRRVIVGRRAFFILAWLLLVVIAWSHWPVEQPLVLSRGQSDTLPPMWTINANTRTFTLTQYAPIDWLVCIEKSDGVAVCDLASGWLRTRGK